MVSQFIPLPLKNEVFKFENFQISKIGRTFLTVEDKKLREFASKKFGEHAGIAHLYIFSYERMKAGKVGKRELVR